MKNSVFIIGTIVLCLTSTVSYAEELTPNEQLGKAIFFDQNLSSNGNQSCASCHDSDVGWTGPLEDINLSGSVYEGSIPGRFGNRKPPSSAYATTSPILHYVFKNKNKNKNKDALFIGGNFWDGRATGEKLGNPAADQAQSPFLNPLEQALNTSVDVVMEVCSSEYSELFMEVWGIEICDEGNEDTAYDNIAHSIVAYEASAESNAYSSKFDYWRKGAAKMTVEELRGFALFQGKGKCAKCHVTTGQQPLFTDYTFDNLGSPRNPENPFYTMPVDFNSLGFDWIDSGLGDFLSKREDYKQFFLANMGKQKVPT